MSRLEPEIQRREHEQRDDELDPEVVRVAGERVRPEDLLRPADGAEHVDAGLPRRDRLDEELVEVDPALGEHELDHAVHRVQADPAEERGERVPVEAQRPAGEQRDPGDEEPEVEDELDHPLRPLRERLPRVEAVEAREVDEGEAGEERERDHRGAREAPVVRSKRSHAKSTRNTDVRTSESVSEPASSHCSLWNVTVRIVSRKSPSSTGWASTRSRSARRAERRARGSSQRSPRRARPVSSTRARRESRSSSRFASSTEGSPPFANRACSSTSAARIPSTSSGATTTPGAGLADELRGRAVRRHDGEDRAARGDVLEDLPGEDALPAAARVGDEEEQRLRVALEAQRLRARRVRDELEAVAEVERLRPFAVRRAEVADEARDGVEIGCRGTPAGTAWGRASRRSSRCA